MVVEKGEAEQREEETERQTLSDGIEGRTADCPYPLLLRLTDGSTAGKVKG